jgi:hypothetical protein
MAKITVTVADLIKLINIVEKIQLLNCHNISSKAMKYFVRSRTLR